MKKYPLSELIKRWEREELSVEQAIGQILLWLLSLVDRVDELETHQRKARLPKSG